MAARHNAAIAHRKLFCNCNRACSRHSFHPVTTEKEGSQCKKTLEEVGKMMIDVYSHILPPKYKEALYKKPGSNSDMIRRMDRFPSSSDLGIRFRIMGKYKDLV